MALKDRLEARRRPEAGDPPSADATLTVIAGAGGETKATAVPPKEDVVQKSAGLNNTLAVAKAAIHALLVERHADEIDITDRAGVRARIGSLADEHVKIAGIAINRLDYGHLLDALLDEVLGLGPLQALLEDPAITEIMINHPHQIYVERGGRVTLSPIVFESAGQLRQVIDRIVSTVGRRVDESSPMCDARLRDLGRNALRMQPDRIVVGECRGGEALDMLQAMNTGHEGSMSTVHANSPYDAFGRLETMVLMGGADLPARAIQKQIASAIDIVVQAERVRGGARKIVSIAEITGLVNGETQLHELFQFRQSGVDAEGNAVGLHTATGNQSIHLDHFAERGETVSTNLFEPSALSGVAGG